MQQGHFAAHIRRMRLLYHEQRDALAETLMRRTADRLDVAVPDQGMHLRYIVRHRDRGRSRSAPPDSLTFCDAAGTE